MISNELTTPEILWCPADRERSRARAFGAGFANGNISYFLNLEVDEKNPHQFLTGDRNLTNGLPLVNGRMTLITNQTVGWSSGMHHDRGNVAIADGSVQQLITPALRTALLRNGPATNVLLFP